MNNCVAINIISNNNIVNNKGIPILFYWDGKSDVIEELKHQKQFLDFLNSKIMNVDDYSNSKLTYFCFTEDESNNYEEIYIDNVLNIQELFPLDKFEDDELAMRYVFTISIDLYMKAFSSEYKKTSSSSKSNVQSIYAAIKSKYGTRVTRHTYIEYIRSEIIKRYASLSKTNIEYIMREVNDIIK
ncbi:MAG: hypothetical protein J6D03_09715 [Clostridia bacterium]|nr:hypothetical protein [Clostridia bacterium]